MIALQETCFIARIGFGRSRLISAFSLEGGHALASNIISSALAERNQMEMPAIYNLRIKFDFYSRPKGVNFSTGTGQVIPLDICIKHSGTEDSYGLRQIHFTSNHFVLLSVTTEFRHRPC